MKHSARKTITQILEDIRQLEQLNVQATQKQGAWLNFSKKKLVQKYWKLERKML